MPSTANDRILGADLPLEALRRLGRLSEAEMLHDVSDDLVTKLAGEAQWRAIAGRITLQGDLVTVLYSLIDKARRP